MRTENTRARILAAVVTSMLLVACGPELPGDGVEDSLGETESSLYVARSKIWPTIRIPVCWETAGFATEKAWMRDAVEDTWEAHSRLDLRGWGMCTATSKGLRVRVRDAGGKCLGLGKDLDGVVNGVNLNTWGSAAAPRSCTPGFTREECIRSTAVHEFGHALGFSHEQNRPDTPSTCRPCTSSADCARNERCVDNTCRQGTDGDHLVGAWDRDSVMNYCNPIRNGRGVLSATDIQGVQQFYGRPSIAGAKTIRFRHSGKCIDVRHSSLTNGTRLIQYTCYGTTNQRFHLIPVGSYYMIQAGHSGKCLDVAGSSRSNGAKILQYQCNRTTNQLWKLVRSGSRYLLKAHHSGKCIDVPRSSTANGAGLIQYTCNHTMNQQVTLH